ncbi:hypothetical protein AH448_24795 [Salmonella enterica subsp. diarizonae]|uniref:Membrane protein n=10 Tax=Salmonella enterica TaxID=28901 RepID=A0A3S4HJ43_SALER|nr:hypothetical protein [Salmonella enterica]EAA7931691.1 hypothetical protein [Salmonella enterica subsp. enterica serovar Redlands]EBE3721827.1 hypothetical protein [Salmonella enterica subsp. diarizonae serovar 42:l,v:1,5,7]EBH8063929.1 hypothetical protein [Salmonella bongori]EBH8355179.1 hypothetical protein [Salmonella enterica subsp. diarizonae serovar 61:l,[v],[z13]:1,5,[7]]EBH9879459.1 hypothetical protein [Salmonella enterica subsp. enterica serovar 6,7:-1,5]EBV2374440.1 hypothetica
MEDEGNPWPSFVDTFSTVLCIFIFLMLVFALNNMLIMYDNSIKVYKTSNAENINPNAKEIKDEKEVINESTKVDEIDKTKAIDERNFSGTTEKTGKEKGIYDIANGQRVDMTATEKEFIITYYGRLRSFSEEDIKKLTAWLKEHGNNKLLIEMIVPQSDISYSDSLRLGYERGIILMKEIKIICPEVDIDMSVNSGTSGVGGKAIITTVDKKVSE